MNEFSRSLAQDGPLLALAPMQAVTDWAFWKLMAAYGGADYYVTEYFRVTDTSRLDPEILRSISENPTGRPAIAQMIGNDIPSLVRVARELEKHPVAAIDLNLGCPAPVVYRKCAGGGLLRDPERIDRILGALRDAISIPFTVKTRIGFASPEEFERLLPIFARHSLDLLTVHGRTVLEAYRSEVHYDAIARAVKVLKCPVIANGNVDSADAGVRVLHETGAAGLMIGRGAIRNPWVFEQLRQASAGYSVAFPTGRDVLAYVHKLYEVTFPTGGTEGLQVQKMKKYLNFLGAGISAEYLHAMRRANTERELFSVCETHLNHSQPMVLQDLVSGGTLN